ncbi:hypothetical protein GCM10027217_11990 [Pseudomaricurvus hydrocarbonicus]
MMTTVRPEPDNSSATMAGTPNAQIQELDKRYGYAGEIDSPVFDWGFLIAFFIINLFLMTMSVVKVPELILKST